MSEVPRREPVFMISTEGKTEDQLADEVYAAIQKHWRETGQLPEEETNE